MSSARRYHIGDGVVTLVIVCLIAGLALSAFSNHALRGDVATLAGKLSAADEVIAKAQRESAICRGMILDGGRPVQQFPIRGVPHGVRGYQVRLAGIPAR